MAYLNKLKNKSLNIPKKIIHERKKLLSITYLTSFLLIFHSTLCQSINLGSFIKNIIYMEINVTKKTSYPIINNLNDVYSIKINGKLSEIDDRYYLDLGENEIELYFNKVVKNCSKLFMGIHCNFIDLSEFDTSQCTSFNSIFKDCISLTSIKLGKNFNTNKANDMTSMFEKVGIDKFISLDLSNFNTSLVKNMTNMFRYSSFQFLNLSNFDTSNVVDMEGMFANAKIISIDVSNFDISKVTSMSYMFSNCTHLISLDISNFDFNFSKSVDHIFYLMNSKIKFCSNNITSSLLREELKRANIIENCNDLCFSNNINKFIISNASCIDNCQNSNYKYEYNNICLSECPSGTEEYPKGSYFCIDIINCSGLFYNYETKECLNTIPIGYYYNHQTKKILQKCPEKCKSCELESVIMDLCIECNTYNFYFETGNSSQELNNYKNCIKFSSEKRYLSSNNNCFESCESCIEKGNSINHKCLICKSNMIKISSSNCYNKCGNNEFYYFDDLNEYHCVDNCPDGYNPVEDEQKCIKNFSGKLIRITFKPVLVMQKLNSLYNWVMSIIPPMDILSLIPQI